ncbi:glycosyltransferase [Janibacter cremeus]|uniref:glycosyltransferase n=2 Tax=Bacteria TaxID=2 RepID=UPI0023F7C2E5|nr:glycosyltransferase [Janibacter cremeus]WEV79654.1 glycosyltransferase [Janibacter cremeus]
MTQQTGTTSSATPSRRTTAPPATVTAVIVARSREGTGQTLRALLAQDLRPDRILLVDGALDGIGDTSDLLAPVDDAEIDVLTTTLGGRRGLRRILPSMVDSLPRADVGRDLVWVLTSRSRPHPEALRRLVSAAGKSVGMVTPKLVDEDDPSRIVRLGLQVTRTGRIVPDPAAGTTDQGQYDRTVDAISAPLEGLLIDRAVLERLGGHDPGMGDFGGDLDLGWRAQRSGHRVVLAPSAAVAVAPTAAERRPTVDHRRQARRVALTRSHLLAAPFLALWILVGSLLGGLALIILKRPGMGAAELASIPAAIDPRSLRSRLRGKAPREVARRDLSSLFVSPAAARRRLADEARSPVGRDKGVAARSLEAEGRSVLLHPLLWVVLAAGVMSGWAARHITDELRHRFDAGLVGGELLGGRATGGQLWDSWWMAWHGQGWGNGIEQSPATAVLAGVTTVAGWIPTVGEGDSPAGIVLAVFVIAALPLAAAVAWTSARTFTHRPWLRAGVALAWVTSAPAAVAVGEGRIGALLLLVLLPRVAAGVVRAGRRRTAYSDVVRTALWAALLGTVAPFVGLAVVLVGLGHLLLGGARGRWRGLTLVLTPLLLAGPWLLALRREPAHLLTGWGLTGTPVDLPPWQLGLGQLPGGAATTWWTAGVLAVGALALLAPGPRRASWAAAATAVLGLGWAVGAPHLVLGHRPAGAVEAGTAITPWVGTGQLVLVGAALVAVLLAADVLPDSLRGAGRRSLLVVPAVALTVAAVGSGVVVAEHSYGDRLTTWRDPRPLVAIAGAEGATATRTLVVDRREDQLAYRLLGSEPGDLVRDLPYAVPPVPGEEQVASAVARAFGLGEGERAPADVLAEQGVAHLVVLDATDAELRLLDASPGLSRLGSSAGNYTWAVRSPVTDGSTSSRVRVTGDGSSAPVEGVGAHADTDGPVPVPDGDRLTVAESLDWSDQAEVRADGKPLEVLTRSAVPTYDLPEGTDEVEIEVGPGHPVWKLVQIIALVLALYLALPTERRPDLEDEEEAR